MSSTWVEALTGSLAEKRRYREAVARVEALPAPHRDAALAINRYLLRCGGLLDGAVLVTMISDHADLWERAAADGTPVRAVVGEDPAGFAEDLVRSYAGRHWTDDERDRLVRAVDAAAGDPRA